MEMSEFFAVFEPFIDGLIFWLIWDVLSMAGWFRHRPTSKHT